jgi:hypothetical protein
MRRALVWLALAVLAGGFAGCGGNFTLPTESKGRLIPSDKSYQMQATWTGMDGVRDILLTQGTGTQLFLLFNQGGVGTAPRGQVFSYARLKPGGPQNPIPGIEFPTVFNPVALCAGGDGVGSTSNRIFVLDQGDTCLARANPATGSCDTTGGWTYKITDLSLYWRVREYGLLGGDTISSFTDTSMAFVNGVAADAQGRVYVAGMAIVYVADIQDPRILTRTFLWRIHRYLRGPKYPGIPDPSMPGSDWHRDTSWVVQNGSGIGTVQDPRGIYWGSYGGGGLYAADYGKNWVQRLDDLLSSTGSLQIDGSTTSLPFSGPLDVVGDPQGFVYVADEGNRRVLRYDASGTYVQRVDIELDAYGRELLSPVTVAADDSLVFVGDVGLAEVIRYKRRP